MRPGIARTAAGEALHAGAIAFLRKAFDDQILIKTANAALKQHGAPTG